MNGGITPIGHRPWSSGDNFLNNPASLSDKLPRESAAMSQYCYNPADPTPSLAGARLLPPTGSVDNRPLESRCDVLVFSSEPLQENLEVIGPVRMDLYARSNLAHTDFFVRLCDVHPDGASFNVCDGLIRLTPGEGALQPDGSLRIQVDMWSTAHVFRPDHRLRVLIASGAHPRWKSQPGNRGTPRNRNCDTDRTPEDLPRQAPSFCDCPSYPKLARVTGYLSPGF